MWQVMREKLVGDDVVYAWSKAPTLDLLLDTAATAAQRFKPHEVEQFETAIRTRQHNPKTEYVRALRFLLQERGFSFTRQIITAVAAADVARGPAARRPPRRGRAPSTC